MQTKRWALLTRLRFEQGIRLGDPRTNLQSQSAVSRKIEKVLKFHEKPVRLSVVLNGYSLWLSAVILIIPLSRQGFPPLTISAFLAAASVSKAAIFRRSGSGRRYPGPRSFWTCGQPDQPVGHHLYHDRTPVADRGRLCRLRLRHDRGQDRLWGWTGSGSERPEGDRRVFEVIEDND